ncbi:MAG: STAS domain-containing protein, partial [Calditrichaceae bacterium]
MSDSNVLYALEDRCLYIKLTGEIRHTVCSGFDALIQQSIQMDQADRFVVDLRETQYLDSTTLGIIARMARHMQNKSKGKPVIISTNDDVNQILNSVQFGSVTEIVTDLKHLPDQYLESDTFMKKS